MIEVDWETRRDVQAGVTFVTATVRNTQTTPQRVRLESQLDGPTWPPRRNGVTAPAWTDRCWEATIDPGRTRGIGFASPAVPTEPAIELLEQSRAADDEGCPTDVLAGLDEWEPPSDVLTPES